MGYSIAAPIKSKKAREKMMSFLADNYRSWSVITAGTKHELQYDCTAKLCIEGELAYDHGKCRIGFNYGGGGIPYEYMWGVLRWISLQVGRRRQLNAVTAPSGILDAVPATRPTACTSRKTTSSSAPSRCTTEGSFGMCGRNYRRRYGCMGCLDR